MIIKIQYKQDEYIDFEIDEQDLHLIIGVWYQAALRHGKFYLYNRNENKYFHRIAMNVPTGMVIDHIDGNPQNNKRNNLRICTPQQNACNKNKTTQATTSQYKGVSLCKCTGKYRAYINNCGKRIDLGRYKTEIEAALKYNEHAAVIFGEYANLNVIKLCSA